MENESMNHQSGVLTHREIINCMRTSIEDCLFISPLLQDEQIGDSTIDIRLGQYFMVHKPSRLSVLDIHELSDNYFNSAFGVDGYTTIRIPYGSCFALHPNQTVGISSLEYIGMPKNLQGEVTLRHSVSNIPITASTAKIQPGFRGVIVLNLENHSMQSVNLYPGIRIAQLELRWLSSNIEVPKLSRYLGSVYPKSVQLYKDPEIYAFGPSVEPLILGVVSTIGAGRTTVLQYLQETHAFKLFSLSTEIKREAIQRGIPTHKRAQLQNLGNELRLLNGNSYLARRLRSSREWLSNRHPFVVVDGFKHPDEVEEFRKQERFYLIGIDSSPEIRRDRTRSIRKVGDPAGTEMFDMIDLMDRGLTDSGLENQQKVDEVLKLADTIIINDGTIELLQREIDKLVERVKSFKL